MFGARSAAEAAPVSASAAASGQKIERVRFILGLLVRVASLGRQFQQRVVENFRVSGFAAAEKPVGRLGPEVDVVALGG